jgi:hypothetical protein
MSLILMQEIGFWRLCWGVDGADSEISLVVGISGSFDRWNAFLEELA